MILTSRCLSKIKTPENGGLISLAPRVGNFHYMNGTRCGFCVAKCSQHLRSLHEAVPRLLRGVNEKSAKGALFHLLALADDFRTINWAEEYSLPTLVLQDLKQLLRA